MSDGKYLNLNNGLKMPIFGLGTWQASEEETISAINEALTIGYRHIDTAPVYLNEKAIGKVLNEWITAGKIKRSELSITTKLPETGHTPEKVEYFCKKSLADLQLDYVDLYLVHTPFALKAKENGQVLFDENGEVVIDTSTDHATLWKAMEGLVAKGLTKSIGLSNFNKKQIEKLQPHWSIKPVALQIEHHIRLQQPELIEYCRQLNIAITAYSPLGSKGLANLNKSLGVNRELPDFFAIPQVKELAKMYNKTEAQILLRWILEKGIAVIPKSTNPKRLRENMDIFDFHLTRAEVEQLNKLDANFRVVDFQFFKGIEKHPEFPF